jgi:maleylacetoacetate isomerase
MKLYGYFRSSAAYRVRIALNLKGIGVDHIPIHLVKDGGQQKGKEHKVRNPQALVPALELDDGTVLTQSLAIIEYLDAIRPSPRLVPEDPILAAKVRPLRWPSPAKCIRSTICGCCNISRGHWRSHKRLWMSGSNIGC